MQISSPIMQPKRGEGGATDPPSEYGTAQEVQKMHHTYLAIAALTLQLSSLSLAKLRFGDRGFSVAAPQACNSLPLHVKTAPSLALFTDRLETELFSRSNPAN